MEFQEFVLQIKDFKIVVKNSSPENLKGVVVLVHGMGEHSGRYTKSVIPTLIEASFAIVTYDNVGHGQSSGKPGHCPSYDFLMEVLNTVCEKAANLYAKIPFFLYGHSMGGNLVLNYALRRNSQIDGIIATSPYLRLAFNPPRWKMILGKILLHLLPMVTLPSGLDARGISRIPEEVLRYKNDPLVHDLVSPMYSFPVMDAGVWAIENASRLKTKTLLLHGTDDPIIDFKATEEFHQNSNMTELRLIDGGFHELHHDVCGKEVVSIIAQWLKRQIV